MSSVVCGRHIQETAGNEKIRLQISNDKKDEYGVIVTKKVSE